MGVDFFLEKENSRGASIFLRTLFSVYRVSQKNEPLFVKYFLGDYKPKIIEILYTVMQEHFYISKKMVANYASIAKLKIN